MTGLAVKISEEFLPEIRDDYGMQNAWAAYVRRRWPTNTQAMAEREWDLTPGRANGLVFANGTQRTFDQIRRHPRGGPSVTLAVEALFWGLTVDELLTHFINTRREALNAERLAFEAEDARLATLAKDLEPSRPAPRLVAGGKADGHGARGASASRLGTGPTVGES